jgi:hypothetical protein
MTAQTTPPPVIEKIENFFNKKIDSQSFAQQIRRANHILAELMMQPESEETISKSHWAKDCFYYLNEFAELINPVLEKE